MRGVSTSKYTELYTPSEIWTFSQTYYLDTFTTYCNIVTYCTVFYNAIEI
jgi:hypothetical protein